MQNTPHDADATLLALNGSGVWDFERAFALMQRVGAAESKRTAERRLHEWNVLPPVLTPDRLTNESGCSANSVVLQWALEKARSRRQLVLFVQLGALPGGQPCLHANDARGARYWVPLAPGADGEVATVTIVEAFDALRQHIGKDIAIFPHGELVGRLRTVNFSGGVHLSAGIHLPVLDLGVGRVAPSTVTPHLKRLEAESIHIIREAVAESDRPVMMYSIGKDSAVMLHLARKAFFPAPPPFPLLHVDTRWKFQEMYLFRDHMAKVSGMELLVHVNPEAIEKDINPFDHGSALHTHVTKTEGLKQALDLHQFDVIFGGARRDEEKSRAKERIFSFRSQSHHWDPKQQRPELWNLYNAKKNRGESIRVFPLSNWTELDIWQYIHHENIPVVPLYFAKPRPVVVRDGMILLVDDARFRLLPGEEIVEKQVRFRTLGCYPLTGAIESSAVNLTDIILELIGARSSERQGRAIDSDATASMEKKKQEGYF